MEKNVEEAIDMLRLVIDEYFTSGEMSIQFAFAFTLMATNLIADSVNLEANKKFVELYENNREGHLVLFPNNLSLDRHIWNLKKLKQQLGDSDDSRNSLFFIGNEDDDQ